MFACFIGRLFPLAILLLFYYEIAIAQESLDKGSGKFEDRLARKSKSKQDRLKKLVKSIEGIPIPSTFIPDPWCKPHNASASAIFVAALKTTYSRPNVLRFAGSARAVGFTGDIVMAILPQSLTGMLEAVKEVDAIVYTVEPQCTGPVHHLVCKFSGQENYFSINMLRYYMYRWWSTLYNSDVMIMLSDFRDVMFQSNPFIYKAKEWNPPEYQIAVFQEAYPNKVIYRCPFNKAYLEQCYGKLSVTRIGSNTVSCAGITIGNRDAIAAYAHLMIQQLDPKIRFQHGVQFNTTMNENCVSAGMDQGFHNWIVYSGQLEKFMNVKIFQQGEGPVNTVGSLIGHHSLFNFTFEDWGVLRGESPKKYFYNWNGDISPVVHQYDRIPLDQVSGGYGNHFGGIRRAFDRFIAEKN